MENAIGLYRWLRRRAFIVSYLEKYEVDDGLNSMGEITAVLFFPLGAYLRKAEARVIKPAPCNTLRFCMDF